MVTIGVFLHKQDYRQCQGTLYEIAAHRLSHLPLIANDVQDIIDDLECHAKILSVACKRRHRFLRGLAQHRPGTGSGGEERSGLAIYLLIIALAILAPAISVRSLSQLTAGYLGQGLGEKAHHPEVTNAADQVGSKGEKVVP